MKLTPIVLSSHEFTNIALTKYSPDIIDDPKSISQSHELLSNCISMTATLS